MTILTLLLLSFSLACLNCSFYILHGTARYIQQLCHNALIINADNIINCHSPPPTSSFSLRLKSWLQFSWSSTFLNHLAYRMPKHFLINVCGQMVVSVIDWLACFCAQAIHLYSQVFHSYEIVGLDNIPAHRPALLIYYHGVVPVDMIFLPMQIYIHKRRVIHGVADRFLFFIPFWSPLIQDYIFTGPPEKCVTTLRNGNLLQISPGGAREALFATCRYETVWNNRAGFARVAQEAKVEIIPIFTRNIRQMFILPEFFQRLFRPLYEKYRLPFVPLLGIFPVKLVTYIGKPIPHDIAETANELANITKQSIETLITTYQSFPASIIEAVGERFITSREQERSL